MILNNLEYQNFRNLVNDRLVFSENINLFIGKNGQGKTNLLEAIYLLSITKSFKTSKLNYISNYDHKDFYVSGSFKKHSFNYNIYFSYVNDKKNISINNNSQTKFKDVIGLLNAVLFVPEDLQLLKGGPSNRRKMMDIELSKIYPKYLNDLSTYQQILKQRNILLKSSKVDFYILDALDTLMEQYALSIYKQRKKFISELSYFINQKYNEISNKSQSIKIKLLSNLNTETNFKELLLKNRDKDITMQVSNIGIHRDDFIVYLDSKNVSIYASQGEQRSVILAIKLALVDFIYDKTKEYPILLLDDVLSELDDTRQTNLIKYLNKNIQTFITSTNVDALEKDIINNSKLFYIEQGLVKEA
ncbi:DNA replication/repair protein RecF [Mycoplasma sp. P36-A1]|uniref:DNA replication/repair protein RecF n=1 Tax=Mycoplasma sp. P36-A1 TaxID=3252900 RepID=UPI003C30101F